MKLKDFLKQFEGLNPELEVGIFDSEYFNTNLKVEVVNGFQTADGIVFSKRIDYDSIKMLELIEIQYHL